MAIEIERKFLLANQDWRDEVTSSRHILQAYLVSALTEDSKASVRVRIDDDSANLNIKSAELGIHRSEYEYDIPVEEAREMINSLCHQPVIDKIRHIIEHGGHHWEIDEFAADNAGLIVAEIELGSADEAFERPQWLGDEVSDDPRYYNTSLLTHPYKSWT